MNVIYVMWLREIKRYSRSRAQIVGSLAQPLLYLLVLGFGFGAVFRQAGQGSYLQFVAPGVIAMGVLFTSIFSGIGLLWDRQFGFLKETLVAPVPRLTIMAGRTLGGATIAIIQGTLVLIVCMIVGFRPESWAAVPMALMFMALIAIVFAALGTAPRFGDKFAVTIYHEGKEAWRGVMPYVRTFGDVKEGEPLLYLNSLLNVAFALNMGNFSEKHGLASGGDWTVRIERAR